MKAWSRTGQGEMRRREQTERKILSKGVHHCFYELRTENGKHNKMKEIL